VWRDKAGAVHPVRAARFFESEESGKLSDRPAKAYVRRDGSFSIRWSLEYSALLTCENGRYISKEWTGSGDVVIRAPGCQDHRVRLTRDWVAHLIELDCPGR